MATEVGKIVRLVNIQIFYENVTVSFETIFYRGAEIIEIYSEVE